MKIKQSFLLAAIVFASTIVTACTTVGTRSNHSTSTNSPASQTATKNPNVVGLFVVKHDKLKNEYRGEIYPIALYLNGKYVDISTDITQGVRDKFRLEWLLNINQRRSVLNAVQSFTVLDREQPLGEFNVQKLDASQFSCSTLLTGQGEFTDKKSLSNLFEALPKENSDSFRGGSSEKQFDESFRFTIAVHQHNPTPTVQLPQANPSQYKNDILAAATTAIEQSPQAEKITGETIIEQTTLYDLNHDGQPEIFATVRKGRDPKSIPNTEVGESKDLTAYVNVWLSYQDKKPIVLSSKASPYIPRFARRPYDVIGMIDIDGNGIEEVIVRNNGYEHSVFGIYELNNNQLKSVFHGAGYGC